MVQMDKGPYWLPRSSHMSSLISAEFIFILSSCCLLGFVSLIVTWEGRNCGSLYIHFSSTKLYAVQDIRSNLSQSSCSNHTFDVQITICCHTIPTKRCFPISNMQLIHLVLGVKALTAVALAIPHVTLKATTIFLADSHTGLRRSFVPEMSRANLRTAVSPTLATRTVSPSPLSSAHSTITRREPSLLASPFSPLLLLLFQSLLTAYSIYRLRRRLRLARRQSRHLHSRV